MIICPERRFVFIKTMKTAGSSVEVFLGKHCSAKSIITPQFPIEYGHIPLNESGFFDHCSARSVRDWMGERAWANYFTFCIERDPWEKFLSLYYMQKYYGRKNTETIDAFLDSNVIPLNYPIYTDNYDPNLIIVNRVLCYENLGAELKEVFDFMNIPFSGDLGANAKGGYRMDKRPASKILTQAQYNRIGDLFAHEIALLGRY